MGSLCSTMGGVAYYLLLCLVILNSVEGKKCKGRYRVGLGCRAWCNYVTGKWRKLCAQDTIPPPTPCGCKTISNNCCKLPFTYHGTSYSTCITKLENSTQGWCPRSHHGPMEYGDYQSEDIDYDTMEQFEQCSPDNFEKCDRTYSDCRYTCEFIKEEVTCSYEYPSISILGHTIPAQYGDCHDESGPCRLYTLYPYSYPCPDGQDDPSVDQADVGRQACVKEGVYLPWFNGELSRYSGATAAWCEGKCEANSACDAWTFNTRNGWCALKRADQVKETENAGFVSGYKDCN